MSQVGINADTKGEVRQKVLASESRIDTQSRLKGWQRSPAVETTLLERLLGLALAPVAFLWTALAAIAGFGFMLALALMKALAWIWPKKSRL